MSLNLAKSLTKSHIYQYFGDMLDDRTLSLNAAQFLAASTSRQTLFKVSMRTATWCLLWLVNHGGERSASEAAASLDDDGTLGGVCTPPTRYTQFLRKLKSCVRGCIDLSASRSRRDHRPPICRTLPLPACPTTVVRSSARLALHLRSSFTPEISSAAHG